MFKRLAGLLKKPKQDAGNYFQIKFGRVKKAVTFATRNRMKAGSSQRVWKEVKIRFSDRINTDLTKQKAS